MNKLVGMLIALGVTFSVAQASELTHEFKNPSFSEEKVDRVGAFAKDDGFLNFLTTKVADTAFVNTESV